MGVTCPSCGADNTQDSEFCPKCGGAMKVVTFLTDFSVLDRIIDRLKLTFVAERPSPPRLVYQEVLIAVEAPAEYFS
jgi:predicted amidophosphoribosyltransferase